MKTKNKYQICVIGGDGIGPEVISETTRLLAATNLNFEFIPAEAGYQAFQKYKTSLPEQTLKACQKADAILFGACTTPPHLKNYFSPIVRLRQILDLYVNLRPCFSLPLKNQRKGINFVIVRENSEGLYSGRERKIKGGAITERVITKKGCQRIIRFAFELAKKEKRKKVTVVHKANIMRLTDGLFLKIAQEISQEYQGITFEDILVDSCALRLVMKPEEFDVIVTTNLFGDILSDLGAALVGGLGVMPSANLGQKYALFEPVHGSSPQLAGQNKANPIASFFSAVMMLQFLGEHILANEIRQSILKTIQKGVITPDLGGKASTTEVTNEVIRVLKKRI